MFDIETLGNALTLTSFDMDILELISNTTKTYTVEMWYRSGGYSGHEYNQDDWVFNGSVTFNFTDESFVYVNRNLDFVDLELSANTKYGIYLYAYGEAAAGIGYKDNVSSGTFEDSNLRLHASGIGLGTRFGDFSVHTDKGFVGVINYDLAPVPLCTRFKDDSNSSWPRVTWLRDAPQAYGSLAQSGDHRGAGVVWTFGVPLYVLYNGKSGMLQVLPELLNPGIALDALDKVATDARRLAKR